MHSTIGIDVAARRSSSSRLARDVERWERLLPHYARSRVRERRPDGSVVVDFVARRAARRRCSGSGCRSPGGRGPGPSRRRGACGSSTSPARRAGWTSPGASSRPATRLPRRRSSTTSGRALPGLRRVRRPLVHAADRRPDPGHVQGPGRGPRRDRRSPDRAPRRIHRHDRSATRLDHRASGVITPIGTGRRRVPGRAAGRPLARSSASTASTRARSARRSPPRSTTSTRSPGCRPRPPASSTGSASSAWSPGRLALEDAALMPGADGAAAPGAHRDLPRVGARRHRLRRGAARALPRARASARSRRTSRWRSSAARRRPTSGSRSTSAGRSSRPPTRAPRARSRSARRSATCARAGSTRRSRAAARSR